MSSKAQATEYATMRREHSLHAHNNRQAAAKLTRELAQQELRIMGEVTAQQNGEGKPTFSNDNARKAEVARLMESPEIIAKQTSIEALTISIGKHEIEARYNADLLLIELAFVKTEAGEVCGKITTCTESRD